MSTHASYFGSDRQYETIQALSSALISTLRIKESKYKGSWMKRGGVGAFMMLARKWDRIEIDAEKHGNDIIKAIEATKDKPDGLLDDINDLIGYIYLIKAYLVNRSQVDNYDNFHWDIEWENEESKEKKRVKVTRLDDGTVYGSIDARGCDSKEKDRLLILMERVQQHLSNGEADIALDILENQE